MWLGRVSFPHCSLPPLPECLSMSDSRQSLLCCNTWLDGAIIKIVAVKGPNDVCVAPPSRNPLLRSSIRTRMRSSNNYPGIFPRRVPPFSCHVSDVFDFTDTITHTHASGGLMMRFFTLYGRSFQPYNTCYCMQSVPIIGRQCEKFGWVGFYAFCFL